jgi:hypothetical protein
LLFDSFFNFSSDSDEEKKDTKKKTIKANRKPIVAILPGVGEYNSNSSSSSDYSSDEEIKPVSNTIDITHDSGSLFSS